MNEFFYELGRYFSYLWEGLSRALALDPKVFQFVETYPQSSWVVLGIVFLAGVSTLLGHSAVLFINRVRKSRFVISLIVNGFSNAVLKNLPMEFAVEARKLLAISLEGSVG